MIASGAQAALDKRRIFAHGHQDPGFGHECLCGDGDDDDDGDPYGDGDDDGEFESF